MTTPSTRLSRSALAAVIVLVLVSATSAQAAPPPPAPTSAPAASARTRALLERAKRARRRGDIKAALRALDRAATATTEAKLLGRVFLVRALTYGTDDAKRARAAFRQALRHDPTLAVGLDRYKPAIVQLFRQARSGLSGTLDARAPGHAGVRVLVDARPRGVAPLRVALPVGRHLVALRDAAGRLLYRAELIVHAGRTHVVRASTERAGRPGGAGAAASRPSAPERRRAAATGATTFWRRPRLLTWIAAGAAAAAAGVAIGFGVAARSAYDDANARADALGGDPRKLRDDAQLTDAVSQLDSRRLAANIAWGVSAGLAVSAVVLLFVEGRHAAEPDASAAPASPRAPAGGVSVGALLGPAASGAQLKVRF